MELSPRIQEQSRSISESRITDNLQDKRVSLSSQRSLQGMTAFHGVLPMIWKSSKQNTKMGITANA